MRQKQSGLIFSITLFLLVFGCDKAISEVVNEKISRLTTKNAILITEESLKNDTVTFEGVIKDFSTFLPIEGAEILLGNFEPVFSDDQGFFAMTIEEGIYNLMVSKPGYIPYTYDDLEINGFTQLEIELFQNAFYFDPEEVTVYYHFVTTVTQTVTLYNDSNIPIPWTSELIFYDDRNQAPRELKSKGRDLWDVIFVYDVTAESGGITEQAGIESDGDFLYTSVSNDNKIVKYEMNGSYIGIFTISGISNGLKDLACDGEYIYGGTAGSTIYQIDLEDFAVVNEISSPMSVVGIAYDEGYDAFWVCGTASDFWLVGRDGEMIEIAENPGLIDNYGLACNRRIGSGHSLFVFTQSMGGADLVEIDFATGILTGVSRNVLGDIPVQGAAIAKGAYIGFDDGFYLGGLIQGDNTVAFAYELDDNFNWFVSSPVSGEIALYGSTELTLVFDLFNSSFVGWIYADINITTTEPVISNHIIPVQLFIVPVKIEEHDMNTPLILFPNPVQQELSIKSEKEINRIRIFDQSGKLVNSSDVQKSKKCKIYPGQLPPGIYIVEITFEDGSIVSKKIIVVK